MRIVVEHKGVQHEVELVVEGPDARVSDLLGALGGVVAETGVAVGERFFGRNARLDEIGFHEGALVRAASGPPARPAARCGPVLAIVDGPVAGELYPLGDEDVLVGRGPSCGLRLDDPTLSQHHARLRPAPGGHVVVTDLGSLNGTWVGGRAVSQPAVLPGGALLKMGATCVRLLDAMPDDRPVGIDAPGRANGLVPFNRPPRAAAPEGPEPLEPPEPPAQGPRVRTLGAVSVVAPLVMGVALAVLSGPRYALFMLASPVMAIGGWLAARRGARHDAATASRAFRTALDEFEHRLLRHAADEIARLEQLLPDAAETVRRARAPSVRLWERRPDHQDFLASRAGIGAALWTPPVAAERGRLIEAVEEVVARHRTLPDAPIRVDLGNGGVVGLVGERTAALALARSLVCQAAVHQGPADVAIAVVAAHAHAPDWDWAKWLPHARGEAGAARLLSGDPATSDALLRTLAGGTPSGRTLLVVVDDLSLLEGRGAPARLLLRGASGPAAGIVIAATADQLPAVTTTVIDARTHLGDAQLWRPGDGQRVPDFVICGITEEAARATARALARYEDPELELPGAGLPPLVRLLSLLDIGEADAGAILEAWRASPPDPSPSAPIGVGEQGVVHLDLVQDGPHGLVAGTTGAGKSELLRSLVAGMAARVDPDHLVFVLVDYKGGSAFDECARLPHVVGMVTDLDEHLGERALTSLEAELTHRERLLRTAGAGDLAEYLRAGAQLGPLPHLVVVVDEFATMAAELPDFIGALVGLAQRGRSLGIHLVLATQRPAGAVSASIKANTDLRIALRVQDPADSADVIDRGDAAWISRSTPGRAYIRRGSGDVVLVQTALATAVAGERPATGARLSAFRFGPGPATPAGAANGGNGGPGGPGGHGPTDLARLVDAVRAAFDRSGQAAPRRPWLEMLPPRLSLDAVPDAPGPLVAFALVDDPARQRQVPTGWNPENGHLALFGMIGSGTTTALLTVARALAERHAPSICQLYAIDCGAGGLAGLRAFPHTGAVVAADDREAQLRLLRHLRREVTRRRTAGATGEPRIVVLIDGISSFLAEHDGIEHEEAADAFRHVFSDGPLVGVWFVIAGTRPGALPARFGALVNERMLLRLADPSDFSVLGLRARDLPAFTPGRAVHGEAKLVVQIAHPGDDLPAVGEVLRARWPGESAPPLPNGLPVDLPFERLQGGAALGPSGIALTLGVADEDLGPAVLTLGPCDHALVAGPPRSGKTSLLMVAALLVRAADPAAVLVGVCDRRSPLYELEALDAAGTLEQLAPVVQAALGDERRWLVLVDDAFSLDDAAGAMTAAVRCSRPGLHVIAAGRTQDLHGGWGHWTRAVRHSRAGVLLQPALADDGALLSTRLPRRLAVPLVRGRGFVVSAGEPALAQMARPPREYSDI